MADLPRTTLIRDIPFSLIKGYFASGQSLFRHYQTTFLTQHAREFTGEVVELGCEKSYDHKRHFVNAERFRCTNIARDHDEYLDITKMERIADNSVDGYVCISVLEHVRELHDALREISRTLRPGGRLILTVPFIFPVHDEVDYWRFSSTFYKDFFEDYHIQIYAHFGGTLSTTALLLQRPKGRLRPRYLIYKLIGFPILVLAKYIDQLDSAPLGIGIVAIKRVEVV